MDRVLASAFCILCSVSVSCSTPPYPRFSVPCNQVLTPYGHVIDFPGRPMDIALSPDGQTLAALCHRSIVLVDVATGVQKQTLSTPGPTGYSFAGIAFRNDKLFASNLSGRIDVAELGAEGWALVEPLKLTSQPSAPGAFAFSHDGSQLLVPMNTHNELWELDSVSGAVRRKIRVGVAPYAVALHGNRAYVSNWGGRRPETSDRTGPTGGSKVRVDARHIASEGSVSILDLTTGNTLAELPCGPHAAGLALSPDGSRLYVACANADEVFVIDTEHRAIIERIDVRPDARLLFGSAPNALALAGDRLYVSNGTNNAVAVIDVSRQPARVLGFIPTAWYPAGLLAHKGRLFVANVKGGTSRGTRPAKGWNSHNQRGSVSIFAIPSDRILATLTPRVMENNRLTESLNALEPPRAGVAPCPVPERHGEPSLFEHVIYIIKENRAYDQLLGDMTEGDGDPALCEFPEAVSPNHHALAREFVLLDRFFCCGVLSADGHRWTNEAYATDYIEKFFGGWVRSYPYWGGDALAYAQSGFLWDNALARGKSLRIYGECVKPVVRWKDGRTEQPTYQQCLEDYRSGAGQIEIRATAGIATLEPYLCPTAIGFPMTVTDQYRADQFLAELREFEKRGSFPNLIMMLLPADHTAGTQPGKPTPRSCVADNDLALGRIIEALSKSPFWPKTCVFVVEDDPQGGFDHVDGRRTICLVASPYTQRKTVIHSEYNQTSLVRTIELILGLPPMNQIDASAVPMRDCFTDTPDLAPYAARPATIKIDELNAKLDDIRDPDERFWAQKSIELALSDIDEADEDTLNRIVWHSTKGWKTPYPEKCALVDGDDDD